MVMSRTAPWVALLLTVGVPAGLSAQNDCSVPFSDRMQILGSGTASEVYIFNRVTVVCDDGLVIRADSALIFPGRRLSQLYRNVSFDEGGRLLTADRADYYSGDERLQAWGGVILEDTAQGSRMEGDQLDYLRASDTRPQQRVTMTGSSVSATLVPGAATRNQGPPVEVAGDSADAPLLVIAPDSVEEGTPLPIGPRRVTVRYVVPALDLIWILPVTAVFPAPDELRPVSEPPPEEAVADTVPAAPVPPATEPTTEPTTEPEPEVDPGPPYHVTATRRIVIDGDDAFEAEGDVEIEREGLHAFGDRMRYDEAIGELHLLGRARSEGEGYQLSGQALSLVLEDQAVREVVARDEARLATNDMDVRAQRIRLFVQDSTLERLSAGLLGPADTVPVIGSAGPEGTLSWIQINPDPADSVRAEALAEDFKLDADSLDVRTPGEILDRVTAIGRARGDSYARDSIRAAEVPDLAKNDWLEGDTIIALFEQDTAQAGVESAEGDGYSLKELMARGNARSLYRLDPSDSTQARPGRLAVHYVVGDSIRITMVDGEVDRMEVRGQTQGLHLEPLPPADTVVGDSIAADSSVVEPDTGSVSRIQPRGGEEEGPPGEPGDPRSDVSAAHSRGWRMGLESE